MITRILALKNIGPFERWEWPHEGSADAPPAFGRVTVIAGENGKGKTTIAAVLRSLQDNDPGPVLERRRGRPSGGYEEFLAKVEHDGGDSALTSASGWVGPKPPLFVFDDTFVSRNVYEGLTVGSEQREALHELVVGEAGVQEAQKAEALAKEIAKTKKSQKELGEALSAGLQHLSINRILREVPPENATEQLTALDEDLRIAVQAAPIRALPDFTALPSLPEVPVDLVRDLLARPIQRVEEAAQRRAVEQLSRLGEGGPGWIQAGLDILGNAEGHHCPFCAQDLGETARSLISAYRAHFNNEYEELQRECERLAERIRRAIPDTLANDFKSSRDRLGEVHRQWTVHLPDLPDLPELPDLGAVLAAKRGLLEAIEGKRAAPSSLPVLGGEVVVALENWQRIATQIASIRAVAADVQRRSSDFKKAATQLDEASLKRRQAELQEWQRVAQPGFQQRLEEYRRTANLVEEKTKEFEATKASLQAYQDALFPKFRDAINAHLKAFGATFFLKDVSKTRGVKGGERRVDYVLGAASTTVKVSATPASGTPHFGSLLSAGDRRTLAFAFFLAWLAEKNLDGATVVCDDPTTSLDIDRRSRTVTELMGLARRGAQLVVLSHFEPLLLDLEDRTNRSGLADRGQPVTCSCLRIEGGSHQSQLVAHQLDRRPRLVRHRDAVRAFVKGETADQRGIPNECRKLLEGLVQFCFPDHYRPGGCLKDFCEQVEPLINGGLLERATFDEIRNLRDFFNPESHFQPAEEPTASEVRTHAERLLHLAQVRLGELTE